MRSLWLISLLLVSACATSPTSGKSSNTLSRADLDLPDLAVGDCALYGWTADEKRSFVFYADRNETKFAPEGEVIQLASAEAFPAMEYTDSAGNPVSLKLGDSEALVGGLRYPTARIISKTDEGWDRVMPVAIVQNCQTG